MTPPVRGVFSRLQFLLRRPLFSRCRPVERRPLQYLRHVYSSTKPSSSWLPAWQDARLSLAIIQFTFLYHLVINHVGFIAPTIGPSMVPTLGAKGDAVLISRLHKRGRGVKVGDVVDFDHPMVPGMGAIKRVVGLPGDFVVKDDAAGGEVETARVVGGGEEQGLTEKRIGEKMMLQVPEGHCWLVGDNHPESRDSRTYGPLPLGLIKGKVIAKVWPLGEAKWIENNLQPVVEEM